jgi:hypothetical protein
VSGSSEHFAWSLDWAARLALAVTVVEGFLAVFMFRETTAGVIDLTGLHLEPYPEPMPRIPTTAEVASFRANTSVDPLGVAAYLKLYARAREIGHSMTETRAEKGITTTLVRMMGGTALLARARSELRQVAPRMFRAEEVSKVRPPGGAVRRPDSFYADVALRYSELMAEGRAARRHLAEERNVSEATVRGWISEAKRRGFWRTTGRGLPGSFPLDQGG